MAELPIIETTFDAFRSTVTRLPAMWRCLELPLLGCVLSSLVIAALVGDALQSAILEESRMLLDQAARNTADPGAAAMLSDPEVAERSALIGSDLLVLLLSAEFASFPFCIAWYRVLLGAAGTDSVLVRYSGYRILLGLVAPLFGLNLLQLAVLPLGGFGVVVYFALQPVLAALLLRLSMVFPALCAGRPMTPGQSWRLTEGAGFSLLGVQILIIVPTVVVCAVLGQVVVGVAAAMDWEISTRIVLMAGFGVLTFIGHGLMVAGLAASYRRLVENAPPGVITDSEA